MSTVVVWYLECLMSDYRYLQNCVKVTPIDFTYPSDLINEGPELSMDELKRTDDVLRKFVEFVGRCEAEEKPQVKDQTLYSEITEGNTLEVTLRSGIQKAVGRMKLPVPE